jgi:ABC-2 type transport system ATP-binding protein
LNNEEVEKVVELKDLVIAYSNGQVIAVNGINLHVGAGEVLGLLGGNGAGKTSTMRAIASIVPPTSGQILVANNDLSIPREAEIARKILGYCPDTAGVIRQGTVREHVGIALYFHDRLNDWPAALELVEKFNLTSVLDRETAGFSHGMSRRLSVLLAALTAEKVLILDEPFDGVDPLGVEATQEVISAAKKAGLGVIISTHMIDLLSGVSDRVNVMFNGKVVDEAAGDLFQGDEGRNRYSSSLKAHI